MKETIFFLTESMCGIAGFWQTKRGSEDPQEILHRMGAALFHRGPDDAGIFHDGGMGIGLSFRRLSILDLSPQGHQPMFSASGRYIIIFNGEVYNFEDLRSQVGPRPWRGHSDTEVMLEAIEKWGVETAVKRSAGMFAFALWDRQQGNLCLVRDRLGIKPLYYGRVGGDFVFGSELKALRQYPDFEGEIDRDSLALYLRYSYVPAPRCIYKGLHKLKAGHILTLSSAGSAPVSRAFWSADEVAQKGQQSHFSGSDEEAIDQLQEKLASAIRLRMIADVPLGAFLSGGIDSSTVVALMQAQSNRPVKTFTIGFHEDGYDEAVHAKKVAAHLGTDHTELYLTPKDALDVVPLLPSMYDEPFSDSSQIPTYLVSKLTRKSVTVGLSGDGGDELFGGYNRYRLVRRIWNLVRKLPTPVPKMAAKLVEMFPPSSIDRGFRIIDPLLPRRLRPAAPGDKAHKFAALLQSAESLHTLYYRTLSHWDDPASFILNSQDSQTVPDSIAASSWPAHIEEVMMLTDLLNYLPDDILTKVDRASMAMSLEARVPMLDHRVVEFAWRLPLHFRIRRGVGKWILRQVLYKHVPPRLIARPKMGFALPMDRWLRGPLRDWAEELLSQRRLTQDGFLIPGPIRAKWEEFISGNRNWQHLLWDVLIFQDWFSHSKNEDEKRADGHHCYQEIGVSGNGRIAQ
ncbi:MAG TPA: asparagine synthase (glutamine-hydrolyzing) [Candidatus Acidoferrales bacterium]|nr:asparagine synthase (glutamine-hydrolyzing) [Candidatus Acidoferrales bacterium]